ncbi:MAG TPA: hypothetical protein VFH54_12595 [Mycobacteriales bacterium]|nr:hypothetical protein [Mycobacteriales bacterium]
MPQSRGELTPAAAERIAKAMQAYEDARAERDRAIAAALKADASIREVAAFTGMSTSTIQAIGHRNGWPTAEQKRRRAEEKAERDAWRRFAEG